MTSAESQDYETIAKVVKQKYHDAVAAGADPAVACEALMKAESELVQMEIEAHTAYRDLVRECGTAAVAERRGVSVRTVQRHLQSAVNALAKMRHKTAA